MLHLDQCAQVARRELVLHSHEGVPQDVARDVDLLDRRVRDPGQQDRPLVEELRECADAVRVRHGRVGSVVVVQPDRAAEPLGGGVSRLEQVGRRAVLRPRPVARPEVASLGGDEHVGSARSVLAQRLRDQPLVVADLVHQQVVRVSRVDERHARLERRVDRGDRLGLVGSSFDRHRHAAETDGADRTGTELALLHSSSCRDDEDPNLRPWVEHRVRHVRAETYKPWPDAAQDATARTGCDLRTSRSTTSKQRSTTTANPTTTRDDATIIG